MDPILNVSLSNVLLVSFSVLSETNLVTQAIPEMTKSQKTSADLPIWK